jgi:hypothetical protein
VEAWLYERIRHRAGRVLERYTHRAAGRMLRVFPDDSFLVSYMKSGNTWLRFLIANLMPGSGPVTFLEVEDRIPMIYDCTNVALLKKTRPRVIASHECFDPRYRRVIYLVRDPRDVAISAYYHHLRLREIPEGYSLSSFVSRWLTETHWDSPRFGNWREHVVSWTMTRGTDPGFLLLRYEDMRQNPLRELGRAASFLGLNASPEALANAIEVSSADRMRSLEQRQHEQWSRTKGTRADVPFVRTAVSGGWRSALSEDSVREIESVCGAVMQSLGYELASKPVLIASSAAAPLGAFAPKAAKSMTA